MKWCNENEITDIKLILRKLKQIKLLHSPNPAD